MRVLRFTDDEVGIGHFQVLGFAMFLAPGQGRDQVKRLNRIEEKLKEIGVSEMVKRPDPRTGEEQEQVSWKLAGPGEVWLEDAEFSECVVRMGQVEWPPQLRKKSEAAWDFLDAAPTEDPKKAVAEALEKAKDQPAPAAGEPATEAAVAAD